MYIHELCITYSMWTCIIYSVVWYWIQFDKLVNSIFQYMYRVWTKLWINLHYIHDVRTTFTPKLTTNAWSFEMLPKNSYWIKKESLKFLQKKWWVQYSLKRSMKWLVLMVFITNFKLFFAFLLWCAGFCSCCSPFSITPHRFYHWTDSNLIYTRCCWCLTFKKYNCENLGLFP